MSGRDALPSRITSFSSCSCDTWISSEIVRQPRMVVTSSGRPGPRGSLHSLTCSGRVRCPSSAAATHKGLDAGRLRALGVAQSLSQCSDKSKQIPAPSDTLGCQIPLAVRLTKPLQALGAEARRWPVAMEPNKSQILISFGLRSLTYDASVQKSCFPNHIPFESVASASDTKSDNPPLL